MIYTTLETTGVETLQTALTKHLPGTAKALYIIRNFLRGLLPGFEVIVDRWPEWQCVVLRPISEDKVLPYFHNTYICHTKSTSALKYFVQRPGVVDWSASVTFTGVPTSLVQVLNEKCRKNFRTITSADPRFMYAWSKKTAPEVPELPDGFSLSTLKPEHVPQMCKDFRPWKTGQDTKELEDYFSRVIGHFDNSCILDEEGELVAYISMQFNCSMTMLNVRPRYRGNDFGTIVLCALAQKLFIKGDIPYGFLTLKDNFLINYAQKLGFVWVPQGDMTWVHYSPKTEFQKSTRDVEKKEKRKHSSTDHNEEFYINAFPLAVQT